MIDGLTLFFVQGGIDHGRTSAKRPVTADALSRQTDNFPFPAQDFPRCHPARGNLVPHVATIFCDGLNVSQ